MAADKERDPGSASAEIGKYLDILAKDPNSRVFAPLAEAYRKAGFYDDAVETALEGLKVHPNYLGGHVALGRAYFEKKQYAEAAAEMEKVVKAASDNIIAHKVLGQIAFNRSDLRAAEKAFKMVLLLDPRDQEAQQFIANLAGGAVPAPTVAPAAPSPAPSPSPVQPQSALPSPPPLEIPDVALPAALTLPPADALPFDEIQTIDDLDLQADAILEDRPAAAPAPQQLDEPKPPRETPATVSLEEFGADIPLDIAEPEPRQPELEAVPEIPEQAGPASAPPAAEPAPPGGGMELEVFSRAAWAEEKGQPAAPPSPSAAAAEEEESPFEVFGRPKRGGPPKSTKGEHTAFGEIDLAANAQEPVAPEPEPASDSLYQVFTREPAYRPSAPATPTEHVEEAPTGEIEIERTAYIPPDAFGDGADVAAKSPIEDLPLGDQMQEGVPPLSEPEPPLDVEPSRDTEPSLDTEPPPEPDLALQLAQEPDVVVAPESEPVQKAEPAPDAVMELDVGLEPAMAEDSPSSDRTLEPFTAAPEADLAEPLTEEWPPESEPDAVAEAASSEDAAGRGVFDTETLASIYVSQGFYGRAAEIYQRLLAQRPDDPELRSKLDGVLALERGETGGQEPTPAAAAGEPAVPAPAAPRAVQDPRIAQLEALLETFRGGRPR